MDKTRKSILNVPCFNNLASCFRNWGAMGGGYVEQLAIAKNYEK